MARGSQESGGEATGSNLVEMFGRSGQIENTGKYVVRKKYLVENEADLTKPPQYQSFRPVSVSWAQLGAGKFEQTVDYEYFLRSAQAGQAVETLGGVEGRFELDVTDEMVPIEQHPNLQKIIEVYQGQVDPTTQRVYFPPTYMPVGAGLGGGQARKNPMAGMRYWSKPSAIFRHTQQMDTLPADIWNNTGKKVDRLPATFPNPPDYLDNDGNTYKYHWIVLSPQIHRRGAAWEVIRSYKLSDAGVPKELYKDTTASTSQGGQQQQGTQ